MRKGSAGAAVVVVVARYEGDVWEPDYPQAMMHCLCPCRYRHPSALAVVAAGVVFLSGSTSQQFLVFVYAPLEAHYMIRLRLE